MRTYFVVLHIQCTRLTTQIARPDTQRGTGYDPVHPSTGNNSVRSHAQDIKIIYIKTFNKTVYFVKSIY